MYRTKINKYFTVFIISFFLCGCYESKKVVIDYIINRDMSSVIIISHICVSETSDNVSQIKDKMKDFYSLSMDELKKEFLIAENDPFFQSIEIKNKHETYCDVVITYKYPTITLTPLLQYPRGNFTLSKENSQFYLSADKNTLFGTDDYAENLTINVTYQGEIVRNNAQQYNKETNTMTWDVRKMNSEGIFFELIFPTDEE